MTKLPRSAALIVVDVQEAFLDPRNGERNNPQAESNIARLLAAWRDKGLPVRHVVHDSVEANSLLRPGCPGNAIQAAAAPRGAEPVYRVRQGDYRILYVVREIEVIVLDIDHRKDVYR